MSEMFNYTELFISPWLIHGWVLPRRVDKNFIGLILIIVLIMTLFVILICIIPIDIFRSTLYFEYNLI